MPRADTVTVYPCRCPEGHHLTDPTYPAAEASVSADLANWLVATKAFSFTPDGLHGTEVVDERATYDPSLPPILSPGFGVVVTEQLDEAAPAEPGGQEV
jgi:hypothetical protein